jgi:hypothetical protein
MSNLLIHVPVTSKSRFKVYLALLNNFIGTIENDKFKQDQLTERELEVLALLSYYNNLYINLPPDARYNYLHSRDIRRQIKEELDITSNNYNNILDRLTHKVLLFNKVPLYDKGNINPMIGLNIESYEGITFKFKEREEQPN